MPSYVGHVLLGAFGLGCIAVLCMGVGSVDAGCEGYPCIEYIPPQQIKEDEEWTFDVSAYVSFNLSHPNLTYSDDCPYVHTDAATGVMTWTPTNDQVGEHFFTVKVSDDTGRYDSQEIKVTVEGEPTIPYIAMPRELKLVQDEPFSYTVKVHDVSDEEREHILLGNDNTRLFEVDNRTGEFELTPGNDHVGVWTVIFKLWFYDTLVDRDKVMMIVENRNDRPKLNRSYSKVVKQGEPVEVRLSAHDPDMDPRLVDPGLPVDPEENLTFDTSLPHDASFKTSGEMTWTPGASDALRGNVTAYFYVRDRLGLRDSFGVTYHVVAVHDVYYPQIIGIVEGQKVSEGKRIQLRGTAQSTDPDADLRYRWYAGTTLIGQAQDITWKVRGKGVTPIRLIVEDQHGNEADLTVNVTVRNLPSPPDRTFVWTCLCTTIVVLILVVYSAAMWVGNDRSDSRPRYGPRRP